MPLEFVYNKIKNTLRKIDMKLERAKYGYIEKMPKDIKYFEGGLYDVVYESSCKWPHNTALEYFDNQITYKDLIKKINKVAAALKAIGAKKGERITDLEQDADMIRAAFMQSYGINLYRDNLHWFEFSALLSCIPEGSKYSEILSIRARPIPEATKYNEKERAWLINAKAEFGLKLTQQEQEEKYKKDVQKIGAFLMALAGEGEKNV